jgi:signal transduction histidine kinase
MGVLAVSLVRRYAEQREVRHLTSNAEAIARQAEIWMQSRIYESRLHELAHTSAVLADVQVRIFDAHNQIVADSGPRTGAAEFVWIKPSAEIDIDALGELLEYPVMMLPRTSTPTESGGRPSMLRQLPSDIEFTTIRRVEGAWGTRILFGTRMGWELVATPTADVEISPGETGLRSSRRIMVSIGNEQEPAGFVELSHSHDITTEALATTRRAVLLAGSAATVMAAVVGLLVSRGLTAPIRSLTSAAGQMSSGNLSTRALVHGEDEIGQLARQFNQMAAGLEGSFTQLAAERDALRRFVADASHELRTPITALRTFNELLQGPAGDDSAIRAEFLDESQGQLDRLEWITQNLLDLSRLDAGLVALDLGDCDVRELMETVVATFTAMAQESGIALTIEVPSPSPEIRCDRRRLELAICNLVDNALKFTPRGGRVTVGVGHAGESTQLWVRDSGPGIDPADLPHIFDRFYRGRDTHYEGSGLGLAIVQSIAQAHGGQTTVQSQLGSGSVFVIELPGD